MRLLKFGAIALMSAGLAMPAMAQTTGAGTPGVTGTTGNSGLSAGGGTRSPSGSVSTYNRNGTNDTRMGSAATPSDNGTAGNGSASGGSAGMGAGTGGGMGGSSSSGGAAGGSSGGAAGGSGGH